MPVSAVLTRRPMWPLQVREKTKLLCGHDHLCRTGPIVVVAISTARTDQILSNTDYRTFDRLFPGIADQNTKRIPLRWLSAAIMAVCHFADRAWKRTAPPLRQALAAHLPTVVHEKTKIVPPFDRTVSHRAHIFPCFGPR